MKRVGDITVRFAVYPGWVRSKNDWQMHYITAQQLTDLYHVRGAECIVVEGRLTGYRPDYINTLMPLRPLWGVDYRPVTETERALYPLPREGP